MKKSSKGQLAFDTEWTKDRIEKNVLVNQTRGRFNLWRQGGYLGVTNTTRRPLEYWTSPTAGGQSDQPLRRRGVAGVRGDVMDAHLSAPSRGRSRNGQRTSLQLADWRLACEKTVRLQVFREIATK